MSTPEIQRRKLAGAAEQAEAQAVVLQDAADRLAVKADWAAVAADTARAEAAAVVVTASEAEAAAEAARNAFRDYADGMPVTAGAGVAAGVGMAAGVARGKPKER